MKKSKQTLELVLIRQKLCLQPPHQTIPHMPTASQQAPVLQPQQQQQQPTPQPSNHHVVAPPQLQQPQLISVPTSTAQPQIPQPSAVPQQQPQPQPQPVPSVAQTQPTQPQFVPRPVEFPQQPQVPQPQPQIPRTQFQYLPSGSGSTANSIPPSRDPKTGATTANLPQIAVQATTVKPHGSQVSKHMR